MNKFICYSDEDEFHNYLRSYNHNILNYDKVIKTLAKMNEVDIVNMNSFFGTLNNLRYFERMYKRFSNDVADITDAINDKKLFHISKFIFKEESRKLIDFNNTVYFYDYINYSQNLKICIENYKEYIEVHCRDIYNNSNKPIDYKSFSSKTNAIKKDVTISDLICNASNLGLTDGINVGYIESKKSQIPMAKTIYDELFDDEPTHFDFDHFTQDDIDKAKKDGYKSGYKSGYDEGRRKGYSSGWWARENDL